MATAIVFLRDDDIWTLDNNFLELYDLLIEKKIPVVYGIIPARLEKDMVRFLRQAKRLHPALLDIVQHGYSHANHALTGEAKYEFGPHRTYEQQYSDLHTGQEIMRKQFGRLRTPGFIPPYHGYDEATLAIVHQMKIPVFSAGKKVNSAVKFLDFPAQVSLNRYDKDSVPLPFDLRSMLTRTLRTLAAGKVTGLVYHHRAIKMASDMQAMKEFLRAVARWREQGKLRTVLFSDLLRHRGHKTKNIR